MKDKYAHYVLAKRAVEQKTARYGMVAAKHPLAALAGLQVLQKGGNAVDAAVATHFALAVVEPFMTGIGGGGRCVLRLSNGETYALNFEPMTPQVPSPFTPDPAREATSFGVPLGRPAVLNAEDQYGYKAAAVPGFVKGCCHLVENFGTMNLADLLQPAIQYAENGFILDTYVAKAIAFDMSIIVQYPETARILLKNGLAPKPWGWYYNDFDRLTQSDLAQTLKTIAREGVDGFYSGDVAAAIAEDMAQHGGYISESDLTGYTPQVLQTGRGSYRGHDLIHFPISTDITQILNIVEGFDMTQLGYNSPTALHLLIEAIKLTFASRAKFLGSGLDPRPFNEVVTKKYAQYLRSQIQMDQVLSRMDLGNPVQITEEYTTHACVVDKDRNVIGMHTSLGSTFGSKVTAKGTGIILNNKMAGYDPRPGQPQSLRPRTIKPPPSGATILLKDESPFLVIGAPGFYKQVTAVARTIHNLIDYSMELQEAINSPRIYVQTGHVFLESRLPPNVTNRLRALGHSITVVDKEFNFGQPTGIFIDSNTGLLHGGVDRDLPHGLDAITMGY
ncbi:MAG: gamma-glutamyltransferase [Candidatus Bathyarchaeota archaeon]|nr:gamma-glutamyltransferase [Candidatus Bathyarchaeota archaeon]